MSITLIVDRPSCSRSVLQSRPSCSRSVLCEKVGGIQDFKTIGGVKTCLIRKKNVIVLCLAHFCVMLFVCVNIGLFI